MESATPFEDSGRATQIRLIKNYRKLEAYTTIASWKLTPPN